MIKLDARFSKLVIWRRKMLFLRKIMKQYEREKSNEKNDVRVIRIQLTRIVSSMKALKNVVHWMINVLSQFLRYLFNVCKRAYLITSSSETLTMMFSMLSKTIENARAFSSRSILALRRKRRIAQKILRARISISSRTRSSSSNQSLSSSSSSRRRRRRKWKKEKKTLNKRSFFVSFKFRSRSRRSLRAIVFSSRESR
jgi:hypothetical protein